MAYNNPSLTTTTTAICPLRMEPSDINVIQILAQNIKVKDIWTSQIQMKGSVSPTKDPATRVKILGPSTLT